MTNRYQNSVAIAGFGSIGRRHARLLKQMWPDTDIVLVRSGSGVTWPEEELAIATVKTPEEALEFGVRAAIISSPASFHLSQANDFISGGVPVLVEKPLSNCLEGAIKFEKLVSSLGLPVLVGYTFRHSPVLNFYLACLKDPSMGAPISARIECNTYLPSWRPGQDFRSTVSARSDLGGGVLLELSHELDYANLFFGPFSTVEARTLSETSLNLDVETLARLKLKSQTGVEIEVILDFYNRTESRKCVLQMSTGVLILDLLAQKVVWVPRDGGREEWHFPHDRDDIYVAQLQHFFDCINGLVAPVASVQDGIAALTLAVAAKVSNKNGRVVAI